MNFILSLVFSTPGKIALGVIAFFVWLGFHDAKVEKRATATCQAETLRRTVNEITRQKAAADALLADAEREAADAEREIAQLQIEKDAANAEMAKIKSCEPVPPAVLERLRRIR